MADNKSKEQKNEKKTSSTKHEKILFSDSDASLPDMECETCGVSFSDPKAYDSHMQGKKHQKKVAEAKFVAKHKEALEKQVEKDDDDSDDSDEIQCEVCDKDFSGYISYVAHMKGSTHAKNVKKQKLKQKLMDRPEVLDKEKEDTDSDDDGILQKPYAKCTSCQKAFSGPENFQAHMKSSAHLKKVKQVQTLQKLKAQHEDEGKKSDEEDFYSKCEACQKSFSGLVPYQIHMKSNAHKKSLEKKKIAEEIKQFCANDDFDEGYVCKECKKTFTDPLGFKCHLQNNSHEKQKAKNDLLEFLNAHPEIVFVTPFDKEDSEGDSDSNESDTKYYLICKLCNFSFSGPESAQDHVKSKKHISLKKEKKMLKLIKAKQNSKPDDKIPTPVSNGKSTNEVPKNDKRKISENDSVNSTDGFEMI